MTTKGDRLKHNPIPACEACGSKPECLVPDGEGTLALCWLCAHAHVDHGCELGRCMLLDCDCDATAIYPKSVIAERRVSASR